MAVSVPQVAAEHYDRSIQQRLTFLIRALKLCQQLSQELHLRDFDNTQFRKLDGILSVMREIVPILRNAWNGRYGVKSVQCKRDKPCRIGLKGEVHQINHQLHTCGNFDRTGDIDRRLGIDCWLRTTRPVLGLDHPLLDVTHRTEVLIKFLPVLGAKTFLKILGLAQDSVHDALPLLESLHLRIDLFGRPIHKHILEDARRSFFGWNGHATPGE